MNSDRKNIFDIIADFVLEYRRLKNLTQREFGYLVDTDKQYIWRVEHRKVNFHADFLQRLVVATGVELSEIFKYNQ